MGSKSIEIERSRFYDKTYSLAPENKTDIMPLKFLL